MKSRIIYIATMLGVLPLCIFFGKLDVMEQNRRVHQHLSNEKIEVISIQTDGTPIPGGNSGTMGEDGFPILEYGNTISTVLCDLAISDTAKVEMSYLATIRCRGNSSRWFDKKSYSIHLVDQKGNEAPAELLGMEAHDEWVLCGPYLDKTLIRNYLCYNIAGEIMDYAPDVRFCELYIDEEYQGLYLLMETITRGEGRLHLTQADKQSRVSSYIVHQEREEDCENSLDNYLAYTFRSDNSFFDVRYPGPSLINESRMDYISDDISKIERILYTYDLKSGKKDISNYIDIEAFAEYFVINEFFGNKDSGWYSTYFYKDVRGKITPCVWDFNNVCDNYQDKFDDATGFEMIKAPWFNALIKEEVFVDAVVQCYEHLRKDILSEAFLQNYIDETVMWLGDAAARNYEVWGYTFAPEKEDWFSLEMQYLMPLERNPHTYEEAVHSLKEYLTKRGEWLDDNIDNLYQYCHESRNVNEMIR